MYAIINDRGHQYQVREGERLRVEKLPGEPGGEISFDKVLLVGGGDGEIRVGAPCLSGTKVLAVIEDHVKGPKTVSIRRLKIHKHAVRRGHRTPYTVVKIGKIEA